MGGQGARSGARAGVFACGGDWAGGGGGSGVLRWAAADGEESGGGVGDSHDSDKGELRRCGRWWRTRGVSGFGVWSFRRVVPVDDREGRSRRTGRNFYAD